MPWVPYFSKIKKSDIFVFLDDVQFQKNGLQNRNYILSRKGRLRLTIPVFHSLSTPINAIKISYSGILKKHWKTIEINYKKSSFFAEIATDLQPIYTRNHCFLSELNLDLINFYLNFLGIKTKTVLSSEIEKKGTKSDLILSICKTLQATSYISGSGGLSYLNLSDFEKENVSIQHINYIFKEYSQINKANEFVPYLSIMDLVFNEGKNAINYI